MSLAKAPPPKLSAERTVVMSARVEPDVRASLEELAAATGLSMGALLARATDLLREDPSVREIAKARAAWNETLARVRSQPARRGAKAGRTR